MGCHQALTCSISRQMSPWNAGNEVQDAQAREWFST
jgi:hypothetical protein